MHSTISPVARVVAGELAVKLDTPGLAFDFKALFASDLSGRARAFQSRWSAAVWKWARRRPWLASWWTMTTSRDYAPVLDRLITRIIPGESPGLNPLGQPLPPTSETTVKVWAARRDYRGRDHPASLRNRKPLWDYLYPIPSFEPKGQRGRIGNTFTDGKDVTQTGV